MDPEKKLIVLIRGRKGILEQMTAETEGSEACARRRGGRGQGVMGKHQVSQLQAAALWTRTLQVAFEAMVLLCVETKEREGDAKRGCEMR